MGTQRPILNFCVAAAFAVMASACGSGTTTAATTDVIVEEDAIDETTTSTTEVEATTTTSPEPPEPVSTLCTAPEQMPSEFYVGFEWEAGEVRSLIREATRERSGGSGSAITPLTVTAEEVTADGTALLVWEYGATEVPGLSEEEAAILTSVSPPALRYSQSPNGELGPIENIDEARSVAIESVSLLGPESDPSIQATIANIEALSDEDFQLTFVDELSLLHFFDGFSLVPGESTLQDELLPNPFGGRPFPAISELSAGTELDSENCAVVTYTSLPDPDQALDILFETLSAAFDTPEPDPALIEDFVIERQLVLQLDLTTMTPRRLTFEETIEALGDGRFETESFTYLD